MSSPEGRRRVAAWATATAPGTPGTAACLPRPTTTPAAKTAANEAASAAATADNEASTASISRVGGWGSLATSSMKLDGPRRQASDQTRWSRSRARLSGRRRSKSQSPSGPCPWPHEGTFNSRPLRSKRTNALVRPPPRSWRYTSNDNASEYLGQSRSQAPKAMSMGMIVVSWVAHIARGLGSSPLACRLAKSCSSSHAGATSMVQACLESRYFRRESQ
mmetsp:Transcript_96912/g.278903  ORF Transcript_96912/g.278903 Transcript_96912/m.278903 type:complete len:219 (+) Transcript_96912:194-850(+)